MLRKLTDIKKRNEGFTIIEVLIVLAIAALILVIVLIAIPQLQRNQRNTARKSVVNRMSTEIGSYKGNNGGKIPTNLAGMVGFMDRYLGCVGSTNWWNIVYNADLFDACEVNITDPLSGENSRIVYSLQPDAASINAEVAAVGPPNQTKLIYYKNGYSCSGESAVAGSTNDYILMAKLEGGAIYCVSGN